MELLKSSIPEDLRTLIVSTRFLDLHTSTAALADYFSTSLQFSELLEQLTNPKVTTCAKDAEVAANWKQEGNAAFSSKNYDEALSCYTKKLGHMEPALRDCDCAIDAQPSYTKAWYRRGLLKCDMNNYAGAVIDMEKALARETTSGGRLQIKRELAQLELKRISVHGSENTQMNSTSSNVRAKCSGAIRRTSMHDRFARVDGLQKHWTKEKGWSLQTKEDLPSGSLVFHEDPCAAVVLKSVRDSHCHFCFEILPADPVPCTGCSIPLYCSKLCRNNATGCLGGPDSICTHVNGALSPKSLEKGDPSANSIAELLPNGTSPKLQSQGNMEWACKRFGEHIPECGGASWSAVLPTEALLGARMLFRTVCQDNGLPTRNVNLVRGAGEFEVDTLCHHYDCLNANDKLELHVLGIVLAHCVNQPATPLLEPVTLVAVASKVIGLIVQARVNAMAIFGMTSSESGENMTNKIDSNARSAINPISRSTPLCAVQQVRVAQGIFLVGSRLNHSCVPNIHASFVCGRLFVRTVTNIPQGSTLELCYGPQVGELNQLERKQELLEKYFFSCDCPGCSKLTLPDLLLRAFQCSRPGCMGVVLGPESLESKFSKRMDSNSRAREGEVSVPVELNETTRRRGHSTEAVDVSHIDNEFCKASLVCKENIGCCLCCGTVLDIKSVNEVTGRASTYLERVEPDVVKIESDGDVKGQLKGALNALNSLSNAGYCRVEADLVKVESDRNVKGQLKGAVNALNSLRATLHAYNLQLAKGEDIVAQLLCDLDQPLEALKHCQKSIEILEHLFNKQHVVIGNEYLKLASVALMASNIECARQSLAIVDKIFTIHYGSDYGSIMPYVVDFQQLVQ